MAERWGPCEEIRQKLGGFCCGDGLGLMTFDLKFRACFFLNKRLQCHLRKGKRFAVHKA